MNIIKPGPYVTPLKVKSDYRHEAQMRTYEGRIISIYHKFFNYTLNQEYDIDTKVTSYTFTITNPLPKWFASKLSMMLSLIPVTIKEIIFYDKQKEYTFCIYVTNPWDVKVILKYQQEGLAFISAFDMIQQKYHIVKAYKRFSMSYKTFNIIELDQLCKRGMKNEDIESFKNWLGLGITESSVFISVSDLV